MYMRGKFGQKNVASTYQTAKRQNGMCFDRDFEWKLDCNAYQIKNVQFGMYVRGNFCQKNVVSTYQTAK